MPDPTTDDVLIGQLRAWADDLADQVGPVAGATGRRRRSARVRAPVLAAAVAVVVLGLAAAVWAVVAGDDPADERVRAGTTTAAAPPTTTAPLATTTEVADLPFEGPTWWLQAIEVDGEDRPIPDTFVAHLGVGVSECPDGASCIPYPPGTTVLGGYDGCNGVTAEVAVGPDRYRGSGVGGTLVGCMGVRGELSQLVFTALSGAAYEVDGDVLTLRYGDVVATFRAGDGEHPPIGPGGDVIAEVEGDGDGRGGYRATWEPADEGDAVRVRAQADTGVHPAAAGTTLGRDREAGAMAAAVTLGGPHGVLVGLVDSRATLVTYRWGDTVVEVPTVALPGVPELRAFATLVDPSPQGWRLWATAADGGEVGTFVHRP